MILGFKRRISFLLVHIPNLLDEVNIHGSEPVNLNLELFKPSSKHNEHH